MKTSKTIIEIIPSTSMSFWSFILTCLKLRWKYGKYIRVMNPYSQEPNSQKYLHKLNVRHGVWDGMDYIFID